MPGVRHRDDDVGLDRVLARELAAERLAHGVDVRAPQHRVRAREVDVLEHALQPLARPANGRQRAHARASSMTTISPGSTSRSSSRLDEVERARLRGDDPGVVRAGPSVSGRKP